ncbi:MAG TPA: aminotransferase class I/II-fold pyridoxal phosphate-dependent enzyme, partial [Candidatus Limnocylindrales bacterium]|nr:aminotransferase class I/II-fold pyridoxal phosphate-dependent enzyme [Candidatus Limnocylindrales bacterium]
MTGPIASARTRQFDRATLALDRGARPALHRQLEAGLRAAIAEGRLQPGAPLPGTRTLADELGVARITVATAYEQLVAEGYLDASARSGTRVATDLPASGFRVGDADVERFAPESSFPAPNPGIPLAPVTMDERAPDDEIDLGPESFSFASVDRRAWERRLVAAWREIAAEASGAAVSYFGGLGDPVLRQALADHLAVHRAVRARPDAIAITSGATAALAAVARVWLGPGRRCVVEEPGGSQLRRSLSIAGAEIVPV